jgi:hypothetical protein
MGGIAASQHRQLGALNSWTGFAARDIGYEASSRNVPGCTIQAQTCRYKTAGLPNHPISGAKKTARPDKPRGFLQRLLSA